MVRFVARIPGSGVLAALAGLRTLRRPPEPGSLTDLHAAAWHHRQHLKVDLPALLALDDHLPAAERDDPSTWRRLHAYRQPWRQATCVFALLDLAVTTQLDLTLGDLDLAHHTVRVDGHWQDLPTAAGPALQALTMSRTAVGARDEDPLLATVDGDPATTRQLADAVNTARRETGMRLTTGPVRRAPLTTRRWASQRRVTATRLEA